MMITPVKRRSFQDHRQYYNNVAPKVETRWPNGIPLIRNKPGKLIRRRSESCISTQVSALLSPPSLSRLSRFDTIDEEIHNSLEHDEGYTPASSSLNESNDQNISTSLDISTHLDIVSGHFKNLFSQLEKYAESKTSSTTEKTFIEKHVKDFKEHARQIDYMINELIERGQRLERFVLKREEVGDVHWAEWKQ